MPTSRDATSTAGARPDVITHFEDIPWGASASDVQARHGDPLAEETVVNGVELAYHRSVNGQQVEAEFTVHRDKGLIVGAFVVPFAGPEECGTLFTTWRDTIAGRYPGLTAREEQEVEAEGVSFDEAFARGEASWCIEWDDPTNLARIELLVWPSAEVFWVSYYGPHADAWEEERFQAELKNGAKDDAP
jgi:hypothetical protein